MKYTYFFHVKKKSDSNLNSLSISVGVLVNNVGQSYDHPQYFSELDNQVVDDLIALNIESLVFMTRAVLPEMETKRRGAIVNISSASGRFASPLLTHYSATKGFVEFFSRGLAAEVAGKGIHVQVQSPLYVTTKLSKFRHSAWDKPTPEAYAKCAIRHIGYENNCSPWWAHALMLWVITHAPESLASRLINNLHHAIRKAALKKKAKQN
jgi:17beta-estradiol 17-dehydrogenase / very-long-chain 3-oxoacyl-CoA reductase